MARACLSTRPATRDPGSNRGGKQYSFSAMPTGLLNSLSLQEVADLFAYLERDRKEVLAKEKPQFQR